MRGNGKRYNRIIKIESAVSKYKNKNYFGISLFLFNYMEKYV